MRATVMMLALLWVAPIAVDGQTCDYDTSKCADTGADCCASDTWGEPQTCTDGYVAVPSSGGCQSTWDQCATYESGIGCYVCYPPGCSSGCSGDDDKCSSYGDDCCACDSSIGMTGCGFDEPATCTDGYVARPNGDGSDCMYSCYPPGCSDDDSTDGYGCADASTGGCSDEDAEALTFVPTGETYFSVTPCCNGVFTVDSNVNPWWDSEESRYYYISVTCS